jgi:hypothetical protein
MTFYLHWFFVAAVVAQPEIFARFLFDYVANVSILVDSVGRLNASFTGVTFANSTARTSSGMGLSTISLDLTDHGQSDGFYVSFWFRFVRNATLSDTLLLASQSVNVSVAFAAFGDMNYVTLKMVFAQTDSMSTVTSVPLTGDSWRRVTVGFAGSAIYVRAFTFDGVKVSEPWVTSTPGPVRPSTSLVLGGTFPPQQLEFKDLVLFWPRNSTVVMTTAFDETVARQHDPNPSRPVGTQFTTVVSFGPTIAPSSTATGTPFPRTSIVPDTDSTMSATNALENTIGSMENSTLNVSASSLAASSSSSTSRTITTVVSFAPTITLPIGTTYNVLHAASTNRTTTDAKNSIDSAENPGSASSSAAASTSWNSPTVDGLLIGGIVGGGMALIVVLALVVWYSRRRCSAPGPGSPPSEYDMIAPARSRNNDVAVVRSQHGEYCDVADVRNAHYNEYDAPSFERTSSE